MEQYKMLREELLGLFDEARRLELYVVAGLCSLYAWLFTHPPVPFIAWFLGVPLTVMGCWKCYAIGGSIDDIAEYLRKIEETVFGTDGIPGGWQRHISGTNRHHIRYVAAGVWIGLLILSLITPFLVRRLGVTGVPTH